MQDKWSEARYNVMKTLLIKKFQQNPELKEKLKSTQQKKLCEVGKHKFFCDWTTI